MTFPVFLFYAFAVLAVVFALGMVLNVRNTVAAALSLVVTMTALAAIYVLLEAHLVAAFQIMVYAGAIVVLFLFVVQMLSPASVPDSAMDLKRPSIGTFVFPAILAAALLVTTVLALYRSGSLASVEGTNVVSARELGIALFKNHYLGVELASLILLIGMVGGMHLGRAAGAHDDAEEEQKVAVR